MQVDSVTLWLQHCNLLEYSDIFKGTGFDDLNLIKIITETDLEQMGITKPGTKKKILYYAQQLKVLESPHEVHSAPKKSKGSRANPYRCTKCCEFKIRSLDGKAHQCKPELIGHTWETCPTHNLRQHPEEKQRRRDTTVDKKLPRRPQKRRHSDSDDGLEHEQHAWEHYQKDDDADYIPHSALLEMGLAYPHKHIKLSIDHTLHHHLNVHHLDEHHLDALENHHHLNGHHLNGHHLDGHHLDDLNSESHFEGHLEGHLEGHHLDGHHLVDFEDPIVMPPDIEEQLAAGPDDYSD